MEGKKTSINYLSFIFPIVFLIIITVRFPSQIYFKLIFCRYHFYYPIIVPKCLFIQYFVYGLLLSHLGCIPFHEFLNHLNTWIKVKTISMWISWSIKVYSLHNIYSIQTKGWKIDTRFIPRNKRQWRRSQCKLEWISYLSTSAIWLQTGYKHLKL
jgi:hypothetical protein